MPSIAVTYISVSSWWGLPVRTVLYVLAAIGLNYIFTALGWAYVNRTSVVATLFENVGASTLLVTLVLGFSGGIIYLLLTSGGAVGYIMAPGLFGFVLAVRGGFGSAQRQTLLKDQTLELAAQALDARDRYTESHSIRVAELAGKLGEQLELGDRECELIRTAGSLHDLGKIGVRDDILNKPGPLSEEEWEIMRRHPDMGADMIAQHSALAEVAPLVRHHHERWDGSGYPMGLTGDVIPFGARILAVADSFDTITGARLYRKSQMTPIEGVEDISRRANQWYDPNVVDALRELHGLKPLDVVDRPMVPRRITAMRVLRSNPGFTTLLTSTGVSALGDPLTQVATLVAIFTATQHDPRYVALGFIVQAFGTILSSSIVGGIGDRLPRRWLVIALDMLRASTLVLTPMAISIPTPHAVWGATLWIAIYPILFFLACINAIVQPARQAAVPSLVSSGQIGKANAMLAATVMLASSVGFGLAGVILAFTPKSTNVLFVVDGVTFALAAVVVAGIPNLGGAEAATRVSGALKRSWSVVAARPHLVLGVLAAFLIPMSFPALLTLAYQAACSTNASAQCSSGGQAYSTLELILTAGIFVGSLAATRIGSIGTMRTVGAGLLMTGAFSLAISISPSIAVIGLALFMASVGNPIYTVGNQTALVEAADPANRGTVMATRFGLVQTASVFGTAVGGILTKQAGAQFVYGVLGVGLILLALYAIAAGRSTTNPLHGAAYEAWDK